MHQNTEKIAKIPFLAAAIFSVFAVFAILFYILYASIPAFRQIGVFNFLFGTLWAPTKEFIAVSGRFGIFPMMVNSLVVTLGAILLGGTVGVFTAIFMVFYCPKKIKGIFGQVINLLAGIPSILYGFFGLVAIVPMLDKISPEGNGKGVLACSLILGIMILPTVANIAKDALCAVPTSYHEGALALGATKNQAVFKVVFPAAKSGVVTGLVLGVGRAIGETMAVMMVAGNAALFPDGLFGNIRTLTTNIVIEMAYSTGLHREALIATGFVLLVFVLVLNLVLNLLKRKKKDSGKRPRFARLKLRTAGAGVEASGTARAQLMAQNSPRSLQIFSGTTSATQNLDTNKPFAGQTFSGTNSATQNLDINKPSAGQGFGEENSAKAQPFGGNAQSGQGAQALGSTQELVFLRRGGGTAVLKYLSILVSLVVVSALGAIIAFILVKGLPYISLDLLFGKSGNGHMTLLPAFVSTGMVIGLSLVIALPIGIGAAIYLVEYAKKGSKMVKIIRLFTDTLAGIPSIVFGLFGMIFFVDILGFGYSLAAGSLTMVLIILPTIIRATEESLLAVADTLREASLALGASKVRTIFKIVLPSALSGIITAIILSIGRIVGESAALIYTAGAVGYLPSGYGDQGSTFAVMMWMFSSEGMYMNSAYATAAVLLVVVAVLNLAVFAIEKCLKKGKI